MYLYVPALRMKAGELQGLRDLANDVAAGVLPRLIVPPAGERDDTTQLQLFEGRSLPDISSPLNSHWRGREVLVEATHLAAEYNRDDIEQWLPGMFDRARASGSMPIPLVQMRDLIAGDVVCYQACIDRSADLQFGIVISSSDIDDQEALSKTLHALTCLGLSAQNCLVIADFHDADLSLPGIVAPIIGAALEALQVLAPWKQVVFQGTNYPEKNPADEKLSCLVARSEWSAWKQAVAFDPSTADHLLFGDYAADCATLVFGKGGGSPIRHYRYATRDDWYVARGASSGTHDEVMREVCQRILNSGHFAGREFSSADDFIFLTAKGRAGPGSATTWRAINTTHHITRVVADVGIVRGRTFAPRVARPLVVQDELFPLKAER